MSKLQVRATMNPLRSSESCEEPERKPSHQFFKTQPLRSPREPNDVLRMVFILYATIPLTFTFRDKIFETCYGDKIHIT